MAREVTCSIKNGPSKMDFMLSLFDGDWRIRRSVIFHTESGDKYVIAIDTIERNHWTDGEWKFFSRQGSSSLNGIILPPISGVYNSHNRKGHLIIEYPDPS